MLTEAQVKCSRAGCASAAVWLLDWRNPRIHSVERVKSWSACAEHLDYLREYLDSRSFLLEIHSLGAPA